MRVRMKLVRVAVGTGEMEQKKGAEVGLSQKSKLVCSKRSQRKVCAYSNLNECDFVLYIHTYTCLVNDIFDAQCNVGFVSVSASASASVYAC